MRSETVFQARKKLEGRYQLCILCAKGTRRLHKDSHRIQDTINEVLDILGKEDQPTPAEFPHVLLVEKCELSDTEEGFLHDAQAVPVIRWDTWPC
jgi:hypothetical protein